MKLQNRGTVAILGGVAQAPRQFTIKANANAFEVLSSGLYNDKIRAVVRELSCNAWDAHVAAGKRDVPFEIHLPTDFEAFFAIKDFGTGMSHDSVMDLYCSYFGSSKNDSNDFVGAMGLGSKSPFCYTQQNDQTQGFTVISRFEGMKRTYAAYIESGAPNVVMLDEQPSDEPNGMEIQFPVNQNDVWEFENKAKAALEFFTPCPTINIEDFEPDAEEYVTRTPSWGIRKDSEIHGLRAIQGTVQYTVGNIDPSRMTVEQRRASTLPLDLFFNIGELSVTASRETLSNNNRTIEAILTMLSKVYSEVVNETKKILNMCKTAWEARIRLAEIFKSELATLISDSYDAGEFYCDYDNFKLNAEPPSLNALDFHSTQVIKYIRSGNKRAKKEKLFRKMTPQERQQSMDFIKKDAKVAKNFINDIEVEQSIIFVLNDIGIKGAEKNIQSFVQGHDQKGNPLCKAAYVFTTMEDKTQMKRMTKEFKKAVELCGHPNVILMSDIKKNYSHLLPLVEREVRGPRQTGILQQTGSGSTRYRYNRGGGWMKNTWSRVELETLLTGRKFYVEIDNMKPVKPCIRLDDASDFVGLINSAKRSGLYPDLTSDTPIYGLTTQQIAKIDQTEWTEFLSYVCDNAEKVITPSKVMELSIFISPFDCPHSTALEALLKSKADFPNSPLVEYAQSYFAVKGSKKEDRAETISGLIAILNNRGKFKIPETLNFKQMWAKIVLERYPMLGLGISHYSYDKVANVSYSKSVLQYIRLMDAEFIKGETV